MISIGMDFDRLADDMKHMKGQTIGEAIIHNGYRQMVPYLSSVITWHPSVRMQIFTPSILILINLSPNSRCLSQLAEEPFPG